MTRPQDFDQQGMIVRPYALVGGRTRPRLDIALEVLVASIPQARDLHLRGEYSSAHLQIFALCFQGPVALAEIAARCRLPIGVTRILVADLITSGLMRVAGRTARDDLSADAVPLLRRLRDGLKGL